MLWRVLGPTQKRWRERRVVLSAHWSSCRPRVRLFPPARCMTCPRCRERRKLPLFQRQWTRASRRSTCTSVPAGCLCQVG